MTTPTNSKRELKLTAALYAKMRGVLEHVRRTGKLPDKIENGGAHIGMRLLIQKRGTNITLTDDEQLIYDAIIREERLPRGGVVLVDEIDGSSSHSSDEQVPGRS
ncbi:MAG: hypothetical protein L0Z50_06255 [Verrucomicrobiales bacterium]|nr:hypothetical protein [Verrucomicrobiales bacterium]